MERFAPFPLPIQTDPDTQNLADSLVDVQQELENAIGTVHDLDVLNAPPEVLIEGMVRYADGTSWDPGDGKGVYYYDGSTWNRFANITEALDTFVAVGYGGIVQPTPGLARPDLGTLWQTISLMTSSVLETPRYVIQSTGNSSLYLLRPGVWQIEAMVSFVHNPSTSARVTNLRLRDADENYGLTEIAMSIGPNAEATTFAIVFLVEISDTMVGDQIRLQIGNGDPITGCVWNNARFEAVHVGPGSNFV